MILFAAMDKEYLNDHAPGYGRGDHGTSPAARRWAGARLGGRRRREQVGKDTAELRYWRELALKELEAEEPTVLEVEANTPRTVGLE
jgi:hypothetical protein